MEIGVSSFAMPGEQPIGGAACSAGGAEDCAIILAQHLQPRADVVGMADGGRDAECRTQEGRSHLGDQLFACIILAAERIAQVAVEPPGMAGGVRFMPISA
jgi:hypothetical protein